MKAISPRPVRRLYVDGRFGQIHLRLAKPEAPTDKPALLCFHMSPMSGRIYETFLGLMSRDRIAIAADTPGFGASDAPPSPPEIADYAGAMGDALDALGIDGPVDVMGYHTGSKICVELAIARPRQIRRAILIAAPIMTPEEREAFKALYGKETPSEDGSHLAKKWRGFVFWNLKSSPSLEHIADMFPEALSGRSLSWWGHRAAFNHYLDRRLPLVEQPIVVFNPGDDLQTHTRRAPEFIKNGRVVELPGWNHGFLDGHSHDAETLVRSFLDAPDEAPFDDLVIPPSASASG